MEDTAIIRLFQERSQQAIAELSQKYGKLCRDNILPDIWRNSGKCPIYRIRL